LLSWEILKICKRIKERSLASPGALMESTLPLQVWTYWYGTLQDASQYARFKATKLQYRA